MGDSFNLGWKMIAVLRGLSPSSLLQSYSDERQDVAQTLIEFDQAWARIISERSKNADSVPNFRNILLNMVVILREFQSSISHQYLPVRQIIRIWPRVLR